MTEHDYLSTACHHGEHEYCQSNTGLSGEKKPAQCKFCEARCLCSCHQSYGDSRDDTFIIRWDDEHIGWEAICGELSAFGTSRVRAVLELELMVTDQKFS